MDQEPVEDVVVGAIPVRSPFGADILLLQEEEARPAKRPRRSRKSKTDGEAGTSAVVDETPANPAETKLTDQSDVNARKKSTANGSSWSDDDRGKFYSSHTPRTSG